METVAGVILTAGRSSRMGVPKALLPIGRETFITRLLVVYLASGLAPCLAIVGTEHGELIREAIRGLEVIVVENPRQDSPMVLSVQCALRALPPTVGAVVLQPVDAPFTTSATIKALTAAFRDEHAAAALPTYEQRAGHPVLIARQLFPSLLSLDPSQTLRDFFRLRQDQVVRIPVSDPAVRCDVDTPEDLEKLRHFGDTLTLG